MDAMKRMFGDFPDRPDHPDFWRMSDVVLKLDGRMQEGGTEETFVESIAESIDMDSVMYMAQERCSILLEQMGAPMALLPMLMTTFMTSVVTGIEFQKAGGHREK